jgi:hypothetical protein
MTTQLVGSHYLLSALPIWASALIMYGITVGAIYVARDFFEGLPYQVSYSAQFGDTALAGAVLIAATVLQRGSPLPWRLASEYFHVLAGVVSVSFGILWWSRDRPRHLGDIYHHLFVAPLILYLAITLLPVILSNGTRVERLAVFCLALVWAALVRFDLKHNRLNQRQWLESHGIRWKL